MEYENSHLALSSLNLLWKSAKTCNCCQSRLWGTTLGRFGWGRLGFCSQAVIHSDKAQRWKGKAEGNRSNAVLTNEESWLGICECSSHTGSHIRMHTHFGIAERKSWQHVANVLERSAGCVYAFCCIVRVRVFVCWSGSGAVNVGTRSSGLRQ